MKKPLSEKHSLKRLLMWVACLSIVAITPVAASSDINLGSMASSITSTFDRLAKLVTAGSYITGLGFSIGAIMKFKQHKDNPSQIPIGTPIALVFIAAALLFLPSILGVAGQTMFGTAGTVAGPSGIIFGTTGS